METLSYNVNSNVSLIKPFPLMSANYSLCDIDYTISKINGESIENFIQFDPIGSLNVNIYTNDSNIIGRQIIYQITG